VVFLDVRTLTGHEGVGLEIPGEFFTALDTLQSYCWQAPSFFEQKKQCWRG